MRLDDDLGPLQLLFQSLIFFFQLINAFSRGIPGLGSAPPLLRLETLQAPLFTLTAPGAQVRRIQAFFAQQNPDLAGRLALVGLLRMRSL